MFCSTVLDLFSFPKQVLNDLKKTGIDIRFFAPLFSSNSLYIGRRLHHKVVVCDSKTILIGGINIADKYHGTPTTPAWLDYAVQLEDENIGMALANLCSDIYFRKRRLNNRKKGLTTCFNEGFSASISSKRLVEKKKRNPGEPTSSP